jgi:pyruvate,water dikinase
MLGERWIVDRVPTERFPNYTRGNAGDVMADPVSPLGWTFVWESGVVLGCRDGFVTLGVFDADEYSLGTARDVRVVRRLLLQLADASAGCSACGRAPDGKPSTMRTSTTRPRCRRTRHATGTSRRVHTELLTKHMGWFMTTPNVPEVEKQKVEAQALRDSRPDLSTQTEVQLLGRARSIQRHMVAMFAQHAWASLGATVGPGILSALTGGDRSDDGAAAARRDRRRRLGADRQHDLGLVPGGARLEGSVGTVRRRYGRPRRSPEGQ